MRIRVQGLLMIATLACLCMALATASAQDSATCGGVTCEDLPESVCDPAGFTITLTNFIPAPSDNSGAATYTYEICAPKKDGVCSNGNPELCADDKGCVTGKYPGPATCSGECRVDKFQDLSHINVYFPALGGIGSCLSADTKVTGTCSKGTFTLGDGSCASSSSPVAKCDSTNLKVGECMTMTITIPGELNEPGLGAAVTETKAPDCKESCIAGPSCTPCNGEPPPDGPCLTRTRGFWGTHPHIAEKYLPVTVCSKVIDKTDAKECSTSEALCTSANDRKQNPEYLTLVAQLTAAKLNLEATEGLFDGATCSGFEGENGFEGDKIQDIISYCEDNFCGASKADISNSGCIEALDAFNNSQDTSFDVTPSPFDKPGPAQPAQCQAARGNGKAIGYGVCN